MALLVIQLMAAGGGLWMSSRLDDVSERGGLVWQTFGMHADPVCVWVHSQAFTAEAAPGRELARFANEAVLRVERSALEQRVETRNQSLLEVPKWRSRSGRSA